MRKVIFLMAAALSSASSAEQACQAGDHPPSSSATRFEYNGDGTVTDKQTMLMWMRCSAGQTWSQGGCEGAPKGFSVDDARQLARQVNDGGEYFFNDWRVPSVRELATIAEPNCSDPRIDLAVFPDTPPDFYWSRNPRAGDKASGRGYALSFGPEGVGFPLQSESHYVRLVRHAP
jgi:hypothetical protein